MSYQNRHTDTDLRVHTHGLDRHTLQSPPRNLKGAASFPADESGLEIYMHASKRRRSDDNMQPNV